jgi:uncharacterized protein (TIGR04255 family)
MLMPELPEYENPPVQEVVLGLQFQTPENFSPLFAAFVWDKFRADFPRVEEQAALLPRFETFGGGSSGKGRQLELHVGSVPIRYWFISASGHELVQFQPDQFYLNWRRLDGGQNYPHYSTLKEKLERYFSLSESELKKQGCGPISINQCEVTYINHLELDGDDLNKCFKDFRFPEASESFRYGFNEIIMNGDSPVGRLKVDLTKVTTDARPAMRLTLTIRGAPESDDLGSALSFCDSAHQRIVEQFTELTTEYAHNKWERRR